MKVKAVFLILTIIFIYGCVSPYAKRYQELDEAYNSGKLTYAEYMNLKIQTQNQEAEWLDGIAHPSPKMSDFEKQQHRDLQRAQDESLRILR